MEVKAKELVELLKDKNLKISAAESCTGGFFTKLITDVAGSSAVLDGSVVSYANEVKINLLGVSKENIERYGVVSEKVAIEMAEGIACLMKADIGVGITGIAGPGGATDDKPVGLVWTAVFYKGKIIAKKLMLQGGREEIREKTCILVLDDVIKGL